MNALALLRHDLFVVRRTTLGRLLAGLAVGVPLLVGLVGIGLSDGTLTAEFFAFSAWLVGGTSLSFVALVTGAVALAGARESGRLRLLLGTPVTKGDVFVGTLASRLILFTSVVAAGLLVIWGTATTLLGTVPATVAVSIALYTTLVCLAYTSIGVTVSAVTATRLRAVAVALVIYGFTTLWPQIVSTVAVPGGPRRGDPTRIETFAHFVGTLSPFGAYSQLATPPQAIYAEVVTGPLLASPTMIGVLCGWILLPVPLGYWRFAMADV
jgi:ABC-type transport system involved in multi-copper enzyme maturation permease subunit